MNTRSSSAWAIEDRSSFQLATAAVYAPLLLLLIAAAAIAA
jgi:hypothetical protein